jgi:hypothetical protein
LAGKTGADEKLLKISGGRIIERQICSFLRRNKLFKKGWRESGAGVGHFRRFWLFSRFYG